MQSWSLDLGPTKPPLELTTWPQVMGILNLTPDSFSDGGLYADPGAAVARAHQIFEEGRRPARPRRRVDPAGRRRRCGGGAIELGIEEEWQRLGPVLERLARRAAGRRALGRHPQGRGGPPRARRRRRPDQRRRRPPRPGAGRRGGGGRLPGDRHAQPRRPAHHAAEHPVRRRGGRGARRAGRRGRRRGGGRRRRSQIVFDPGIGFGKKLEHNLALLARLGELAGAPDAADAAERRGYPLLVGASRKASSAPSRPPRPRAGWAAAWPPPTPRQPAAPPSCGFTTWRRPSSSSPCCRRFRRRQRWRPRAPCDIPFEQWISRRYNKS